MITILTSIAVIALVLTIWFRTEAYIEYCRILHLNRISFYRDYDNKKKDDISLTYLGYLKQYHDCFITRLIICPICLSVWMSLIVAIILSGLSLLPIIFVGGLILFGIINRLLD